MTQSSANKAIKLALNQNWKEAIKVNKEILSDDPTNTDALKRLGFAYVKSGNTKKARVCYKKVLRIDKHNPIATKALQMIESNSESFRPYSKTSTSVNIFLEEPGRTKIVSLLHLAPANILCQFNCGQKVILTSRKRALEIRSDKKVYLGALPDDISHRLIKLITGGNEYDVYIKHVEKKSLSVFIKEIKRGKKYKNIPSFTSNIQSLYTPYVRKSLVKDEKPDVETLEEKEE